MKRSEAKRDEGEASGLCGTLFTACPLASEGIEAGRAGGERRTLLEGHQGADEGSGTGHHDRGIDTEGAGNKSTWIIERGVDGVVRIHRRGLGILPSELGSDFSCAGIGSVVDFVTGRIGQKAGCALIVIHGGGTGGIGGGGDRDAAADVINEGTNGGDGAKHAGLEDRGAIVGLVEDLALLGLHNIAGVHLLTQTKYKNTGQRIEVR